MTPQCGLTLEKTNAMYVFFAAKKYSDGIIAVKNYQKRQQMK